MPAPVGGIHIWSDGDTWWDIAHRYTGSGLNWVLIADANTHIQNPNRVPVGTRVSVPLEILKS